MELASPRLLSGLAKWGVFVKLKTSARNCIWSRSLKRKSRNKPRSQLKTPGPRRLLKPEVPSDCRQSPGLFGFITSANAEGSYQKPDLLPILFGVPTISTMVGELPGQAASQFPVTLKGEPLNRLTTLFTCHPETIAVIAPLLGAHFWPRPNGRSQILVIA